MDAMTPVVRNDERLTVEAAGNRLAIDLSSSNSRIAAQVDSVFCSHESA
jgi:RNase H-fold protein (predicted Holliday junction resolvase)